MQCTLSGPNVLCAEATHFSGFAYGVPRDSDGDFIIDLLDNCPADVNFFQNDDDLDDIGNACDNCTVVPNPDQRDSNDDGYGNVCDPDFDGNGNVDFADLAYIKSKFFTADPDADLDGDSRVDFADLAIQKAMFFQPPGPSGLAP
jgi:hypothetical protein